jgi:hypothetical protein
MNQKIIFTTLIIFLFVLESSGQSTTEGLARKIFNCFQTHILSELDTLIPTVGQTMEIAKNKGLDVKEVSLKKNYEEIHQQHILKFKEKCRRFISDTTIYNIDWASSIFDTSILKEKEINLTIDSAQNSKKVIMYSLEIIFTDKKNKYFIGFKDIYNYNGLWKIGDNVRFRRFGEENYQ